MIKKIISKKEKMKTGGNQEQLKEIMTMIQMMKIKEKQQTFLQVWMKKN